MPPKTKCAGTSKKTGQPCNAYALTDGPYCLAHADAETREKVGFIPDNGKGGRPKNPRVVDVIREKVEARADEILGAMFEALEADQGIALSIKGGGMEIACIPDHRTRLMAAKDLLDRAYGKPKQQTEITGADGGAVAFEIPVDSVDRSTRAAALLAQNGLVPLAVTTGNGNGNGNGHRN